MRARTSFTPPSCAFYVSIYIYYILYICVCGDADRERERERESILAARRRPLAFEPLQKRSILDSQRFITSSNMAPILSLSLSLSLHPSPSLPSHCRLAAARGSSRTSFRASEPDLPRGLFVSIFQREREGRKGIGRARELGRGNVGFAS